MRVEAKFTLPDEGVLGRLASLPALAGYELGAPQAHRDDDLYLDTTDRRLLLARHALRLRRCDGGLTLTLRRLNKPVEGALLGVDELEGRLFAGGIRRLAQHGQTSVDHVEPDALYQRLSGLVRGEPVRRLLGTQQDRLVRPVRRGGDDVGELDLVRITLRSLEGAPTWRVARLRLGSASSHEDLQRIAIVLRDQWRLAPVVVSTFEQALRLAEEL